jgi:alpha-acetolactate decarboxylase
MEDRTLLGRPVDLVTPASLSDRYTLVELQSSGHAMVRWQGFAIAIAWPRLRRVLASKGIHYRGDASAYGAAAFDYLIAQGASFQEVIEDLPGVELPASDAELEEALGNSEIDTEGSD